MLFEKKIHPAATTTMMIVVFVLFLLYYLLHLLFYFLQSHLLMSRRLYYWLPSHLLMSLHLLLHLLRDGGGRRRNLVSDRRSLELELGELVVGVRLDGNGLESRAGQAKGYPARARGTYLMALPDVAMRAARAVAV